MKLSSGLLDHLQKSIYKILDGMRSPTMHTSAKFDRFNLAMPKNEAEQLK